MLPKIVVIAFILIVVGAILICMGSHIPYEYEYYKRTNDSAMRRFYLRQITVSVIILFVLFLIEAGAVIALFNVICPIPLRM
jgi:hypothetical protein